MWYWLPMATFVLVHPAWFGGWCWKKITPLLDAQGHSVYTPTLTGLGERDHLASNRVGRETHIDDITNVLVFEDLDRVILAANSSAGGVITAVAIACLRIQQVVYVDAFVPADGERLLDIIPPDRRAAMEELAEREGGGWLLPRMAAAPWQQNRSAQHRSAGRKRDGSPNLSPRAACGQPPVLIHWRA